MSKYSCSSPTKPLIKGILAINPIYSLIRGIIFPLSSNISGFSKYLYPTGLFSSIAIFIILF
jgi:hypothetical protein